MLPLFPLPNVVLFPNVFLPLHIFEPRYREMVADSLADDRLIGMVLLRPGWKQGYDGCPPIYQIGCSGVITHYERLADGRYNIVLRGLERIRVLKEDNTRSYRQGIVEPFPEGTLSMGDRAALQDLRAKLEGLLAPHDRMGGGPNRVAAMEDADLVNALAQYLDLEPLEKQALLERGCLRSRAESLVELLEMKIMIARTPGASNVTH